MLETTDYQKVAALLDIIKAYDIRLNPTPRGLFTADMTPIGFLKVFHPTGLGLAKAIGNYELPLSEYVGFTIHCTPHDNPGGKLYERLNAPNGLWARVVRTPTTHTKPSSPLAKFTWVSPDLGELTLCTEAHALASDGLLRGKNKEPQNRSDDVAWATEKLEWLWGQAFPTQPLPQITLVTVTHPAPGENDLY